MVTTSGWTTAATAWRTWPGPTCGTRIQRLACIGSSSTSPADSNHLPLPGRQSGATRRHRGRPRVVSLSGLQRRLGSRDASGPPQPATTARSGCGLLHPGSTIQWNQVIRSGLQRDVIRPGHRGNPADTRPVQNANTDRLRAVRRHRWLPGTGGISGISNHPQLLRPTGSPGAVPALLTLSGRRSAR
jgi:hypothetical protein